MPPSQQFELAAKLNPLLAGARFQLYNLYRQAGRREDAARSLEAFQRLKKESEGAAIAEDVDWCYYAEVYDPPREVTPPAAAPAAPRTDRVHHRFHRHRRVRRFVLDRRPIVVAAPGH